MTCSTMTAAQRGFAEISPVRVFVKFGKHVRSTAGLAEDYGHPAVSVRAGCVKMSERAKQRQF
jgi:hypothetical protein